MTQISRRKFIQTGLIGTAVLSAGFPNVSYGSSKDLQIDRVNLGKTGLKVPRLALGTGTHGGNQSSDMTRMGVEN